MINLIRKLFGFGCYECGGKKRAEHTHCSGECAVKEFRRELEQSGWKPDDSRP